MHWGSKLSTFVLSVAALALLGCVGCVDGLLPASPASPATEDITSNTADDASAGVATGVLGTEPETINAPLCVAVGEPATPAHQAMFDALNEYRVANGLPKLIYSKTLEIAADAMVIDLWQRSFFAHINPDGLNPGQRAVNAGFCHQYVGENLAAGQNTLDRAMTAWKNSPGHNANMLHPAYVYVGVSYSVDTNGRYYWAQELAYELP
jgi:uncharacterized protein YkwD